MTTSTINTLPILNGLIETNVDSALLFRAAAEAVDREALCVLFRHFTKQRQAFAGELQRRVQAEDQGREDAVSLSAALHVGWMQLRAALAQRGEAAIISECLRSEEATLLRYEEAMAADLSAVVRAFIERHHEHIKESYLRLYTLNEAYTV